MAKLAEQLKQGADQARESLSEGWREISSRASSALTRFLPSPTADATSPRDDLFPIGSWAFMGADVLDKDDKLIVRVEAPGMRREDLNVELRGDVLSVWGEKRFDNEAKHGRYSVVQCAYGSFRRDVALPVSVKPDKIQASYRDGVLRIDLPKADGALARRIAVQTT